MLKVGLIEMKNRILYRWLETKYYLCTITQEEMGINKLKVVLTEEAQTGKYRDMGVSNPLQWYMLQAFLLLGY